MKTRNLSLAALFLALAIALPITFHFFIPQGGNIFLPMHLPVLLAGPFVGIIYAGIIGLTAPFMSFLLSGMPPFPIWILMCIELTAMGLLYPALIRAFSFAKFFKYIIALIITILLSRIIYFGAAILLINLGLGIPAMSSGMIIWLSGSLVKQIPGLIAQIVLIPLCLKTLQPWVLNRYKF